MQVGQLGLGVGTATGCSGRPVPSGPRAEARRAIRLPWELTATTRPLPEATSRGNSRPVSANGPKWLVAICSSSPSAVRWCGRRHHAGVVDQQVERHRRPGSTARRTEERSETSMDSGCSAAPGTSFSIVRIDGLQLGRVAGAEDHLGAVPGELDHRLLADAAGDARDQRARCRSGRGCRPGSRAWPRSWGHRHRPRAAAGRGPRRPRSSAASPRACAGRRRARRSPPGSGVTVVVGVARRRPPGRTGRPRRRGRSRPARRRAPPGATVVPGGGATRLPTTIGSA